MQIDPYPGICGPFTLSLLDYNYIYTVSSNLVIEIICIIPVNSGKIYLSSCGFTGHHFIFDLLKTETVP